MILSAITFILALIFVAPRVYKKCESNKFSSTVVMVGIITLSMILLLIFTNYIFVISPEECNYSLEKEKTVIPIGYNQSEPPANFLFDGEEYRYISSDNREKPIFSTVESEYVHINYTDGPARIETYRPVGFKHLFTWFYGLLSTSSYRYEIYAPKETVQFINPE